MAWRFDERLPPAGAHRRARGLSISGTSAGSRIRNGCRLVLVRRKSLVLKAALKRFLGNQNDVCRSVDFFV